MVYDSEYINIFIYLYMNKLYSDNIAIFIYVFIYVFICSLSLYIYISIFSILFSERLRQVEQMFLSHS